MIKKFGIFWIGTQREVYGDDNFYTLGMLWKVIDTYEEAEEEIIKMNLKPNNLVTIIPIYSGLAKSKCT
jgi:hypothetical protein